MMAMSRRCIVVELLRTGQPAGCARPSHAMAQGVPAAGWSPDTGYGGASSDAHETAWNSWTYLWPAGATPFDCFARLTLARVCLL